MATYSKMSWSKIKQLFEGEWVELVELDWDWSSPFPRTARVKNHAPDRSELLELMGAEDQSANSVVLFVGAASAVVNFESSVTAL